MSDLPPSLLDPSTGPAPDFPAPEPATGPTRLPVGAGENGQTGASSISPRWSTTTKLIVGLTCVATVAGIAIYSRNIIGPLILAFILASLIQPIAAWMSRVLHFSWRLSVNIVYLLLLVSTTAIFAVAGLAIFQQAQSLVEFIQSFINNLPTTMDNLFHERFNFGPFAVEMARLDIAATARQMLNMVEPAVSQAGGMLGTVATSAATTAWWGIFIVLVSYFLLTATSHVQKGLVQITIPGYDRDISRMVEELGRIWGAFFRGQIIYALLITIAYYIMLTILGTRLALVIAIMAGLAAFIPYLGPAIVWVVTGIVTFLQPNNYFGLAPFYYMLLVVICCLALNQIIDNFVYPRLMGNRLGVHPAGILIAVIIAADLLGLVGLVLAAPILATLTLLARYAGRKLFDLDPWEEPAPQPEIPNVEKPAPQKPGSFAEFKQALKALLQRPSSKR